MLFRRSLEVSISRDDFLRLLGSVVDDFTVDGDAIECNGAHVQATVRLVPLANRDAGGDATPRLLVNLELDASCDAEAEVFMERFDRAFLRGRG